MTSVLLVEDDGRIREALGLSLADHGFDVVEAVSGEQALSVVESTPVDVVLLDLMLPGIDGMDVCRSLRSRGDLPIIMVTARTDTRDVIEGLEAGADDYVTNHWSRANWRPGSGPCCGAAARAVPSWWWVR